MGNGATNQPAATELGQADHLGQRNLRSALRRRPTIDTLMATFAAAMRPLLVEKPLQLLGSGDANLVEQLEAKRLHRALQDSIQGKKPRWESALVHLEHTQLTCKPACP